MSRRTTQFIYSLLGINQSPPAPPTPPPSPPGATVPPIHGAINANDKFANPANNPALATKLTQVNSNAIATAAQFDKERQFRIFVPSGFVTDYKNAPAGGKPKARVSLFYGVGAELGLFRLRDFFAAEKSVIITVSGVESESTNPPVPTDSWGGIHIAFGYGISKQIIIDLFKKAALDPVNPIDFDVEVIAGYSTGYRGVNLTVINELVDLSKLKRLIYLDAWYHHDDHPLIAGPYNKKNTLLAVDTALTKSPTAQLVIYAYTPGGVPRSDPTQTNPALPSPPRETIANLITKYPNRINFIDFNFKFGTRPAIETQLEKICFARLIQFGTGSKFPATAIDAGLVPLISALPVRGTLGTIGLAGFTDLYSWINSHQTEINGFDFTKAFDMVKNFQLLDSWTDSRRGEMRHRTFVIELGREPLVP